MAALARYNWITGSVLTYFGSGLRCRRSGRFSGSPQGADNFKVSLPAANRLVLAASQSYQAAIETSRLRHGFLTYAVAEEGLKSAVSDRAPRDGQITVQEWFRYATERVPELQLEAINQREPQHLLTFGPFETRRSQLQTPRWFSRRDANLAPLVVAIP
jgi:hypothetical protein